LVEGISFIIPSELPRLLPESLQNIYSRITKNTLNPVYQNDIKVFPIKNFVDKRLYRPLPIIPIAIIFH
jgi:hypothetical protein